MQRVDRYGLSGVGGARAAPSLHARIIVATTIIDKRAASRRYWVAIRAGAYGGWRFAGGIGGRIIGLCCRTVSAYGALAANISHDVFCGETGSG